MVQFFHDEFEDHIQTAKKTLEVTKDSLSRASKMLCASLDEGGKLLICGNGGSAADSQHFAAELTGRYKKERKGIPAIALSTDTSALTAIGNDYGFEYIFARQVEALAQEKDVLLGISTSGCSQNILLALKEANKKGCKTIGFSGKGGGIMREFCDINLIVPSDDTARIQEMHILFVHLLCHTIENYFVKKGD